MTHLKTFIRQIFILSLALCSGYVGILAAPVVSAAPSSTVDGQISPATKDIFLNQLCTGLDAVGTPYSKTVYKSHCKTYTKESEQDSAAKGICSIYGGKLSAQCAAYNQAITADAGGSNATTTGGLQSDCTPGTNGGCVDCGNTCCSDPAAVTDSNPNCAKCSDSDNGVGCDIVKKYVNPIINVLSVIFGLIAIISIILGGIQYITSTGDPQKVSKAKGRIVNTIIAIVAYFFLYAFLQFLIPGGIF